MPIKRYGVTFEDAEAGVDPSASIELAMCFNPKHWQAKGFLGRFEHLRNAIDLIWNIPRRRLAEQRGIVDYDPDHNDPFIWNDWTELMMRTFVETPETVIAGPGASWKSTCAACYTNCFWAASPPNTRVIVTSTTGDGLRARIWKEIMHFYRAIGLGNPVPSRTVVQFIKGDDGAGLFGIAVESDGNVQKAVNKIIGRHNKNMLVVVDELPTVSSAIVDACVNLETGADQFQVIGLGNPDSHLDPHGKMAEPKDGWSSVSVDTETWPTRRGGICIHLDGTKTPNIRANDKYPGLIRQRDIDRSAERDGEDSPKFWKQRRGFWAPEGITKTVLTETLIEKFHASEKVTWVGEYVDLAGFDPAFEGGDRRVLRFARAGMMTNNVVGLEMREILSLKLDVTSKEPIHYQLARQVKQECEARGIKAEHFGMDTTGEGGGLASIIMRQWSGAFMQVEFGGRAPDDPISLTNPTPASQEYLYMVTYLWFFYKELVQGGHIRGLDDDTAIEFCQREYEMVGNLMKLESKKEMKKRTGGRSPDFADAAVVVAQVFRRIAKSLGFDLGGSEVVSARSQDEWREFARKHDVVNHEYADV